MIPRKIKDTVQSRLTNFDSAGLLGPRQVGKTTLAHQITTEWGCDAQYLDLERRVDREKLEDPVEYFSRYCDQLIVLDEIHRAPEIFSVLRGQIDDNRRNGTDGRFLLLGSASIHLMRQSTESLAGRISYVDMASLSWQEIEKHTASGSGNKKNDLDRLWLQGGFPLAYGHNPETSMQWRKDFVRTYLERDLPQFQLRTPSDRMDLFWHSIAHNQGGLFNAERYARLLRVSGNSVRHYLKISEQLLMFRALQPWYSNLDKRMVKSPKVYVRDSGILHAILGLRTVDNLETHQAASGSWEGFVIENLLQASDGKARPYFLSNKCGSRDRPGSGVCVGQMLGV